MKLSKAQMTVLATLHVMQPCTVTAVNMAAGRHDSYSNDALQQLVGLKLVIREKWKPEEIKLTEAQRLGFEDAPQARLGKRPYIYRLAPAAAALAEYLHWAEVIADEVLADD